MRKLLIISLIAVFVMESCSDKIHETSEFINDDLPITAQLDISTKEVIHNSDAFEIDFVRMNASATTSNYSFTTTGNGYRAASITNGVISFTNQFYNKNNDYSYFRCFNKLSPTKDEVARTYTWVLNGKSDLLASDVWDAGTYTTPSQTAIKFKHLLSKIEVKCQAKTTGILSVVQLLWGNITSITVLTNQKVIYNYSTNTFSYTTPINLPLNEGLTNNIISNLGISILDFGSENITANVLLPSTTGEKITLKIKTILKPEQTIEITIPGGLVAGKIHTITINFSNITLTKSTLEDNDITFTHSTREW